MDSNDNNDSEVKDLQVEIKQAYEVKNSHIIIDDQIMI